MLTKKQFLILFLVTLVPFLFYFARPGLAGLDSYYFMNHVCNGIQVDAPPLALTVFSLLPCDFFLIKLLLFSLAFTSVLAVALSGSLFDKENGWKSGYFLFLTPIFFQEFTKFENDQLAYPIIFFAVFFALKALTQEKWRHFNSLASFGLIFASILFWQGGFLYVFAFAMNFTAMPLFVLFTLPILLFYDTQIISVIAPNLLVWENLPLIGIIFLFFLVFGYLSLPKKLWPTTAFLTAVVVLNSKFAFLILPFLAIGMVFLENDFKLLEKTEKTLSIPLTGTKIRKATIAYYTRTAMTSIVIGFIIALGFLSFLQIPTETHWDAVDYALSQNDENIHVDWDLGHLVNFKTKTDQFNASSPQNQREFGKGIILTRQDLNCSQLKEFYDGVSEIRVYNC